VSLGVTVLGSFIARRPGLYVWIRVSTSEQERGACNAEMYESRPG